MSRRLVVVSNRVASPRGVKPGGLAMAMQAALRETGGIWFGWSGNLAASTGGAIHRERLDNTEYTTIDLCRRDHEEYYAGFANRTLWPLFHFRPGLVDFSHRSYEGYLRVNGVFADSLARILRPDDVVWVHDYHLLPLGALLRKQGVRSRIGFFLHTPLPPAELLRVLPVHRELFQTLAAYDLVGFHTPRYVKAFRDYALEELDAEINEQGVYSVRGGRDSFRVGAFPISIDTAAVARESTRSVSLAAATRLQRSLDGKDLVIGVDRLDYSKGLPERFKAYQRFLADYPEHHRQVTMLQIAPPSRGEVPEYQQLRQELERIAGSINGRYADADWVPLRYVNKSYQHSTLTGFYRLARVGLVTPFRDGMNLVAKEYVACQDPDDPGVLVLSRFAGAADELGAAMLVNPYDIAGMASGLRAALSMPLAERRTRWREMMDILERCDITCWRQAFLQALVRQRHAGKPPEPQFVPPHVTAPAMLGRNGRKSPPAGRDTMGR